MKIQHSLSELLITNKPVEVAILPNNALGEVYHKSTVDYANIANGDYKLLFLDFLELLHLPDTAALVKGPAGSILIQRLDDDNYSFTTITDKNLEVLSKHFIYSMKINSARVLSTFTIRQNTGSRNRRLMFSGIRLDRTIHNLAYFIKADMVPDTATNNGYTAVDGVYTELSFTGFHRLNGGRYEPRMGSVNASFIDDKVVKALPKSVIPKNKNVVSVFPVHPHMYIFYSPKYACWCVSTNLMSLS